MTSQTLIAFAVKGGQPPAQDISMYYQDKQLSCVYLIYYQLKKLEISLIYQLHCFYDYRIMFSLFHMSFLTHYFKGRTRGLDVSRSARLMTRIESSPPPEVDQVSCDLMGIFIRLVS